MNVMEVVSTTWVNGAIRHCWLLSSALADRGHRVTFVCDPKSWLAKQAAGRGIEVIASDLHRWPIDELRRIARAAAERRIDVIHTHMSRAHFFGVLLRWASGIPCVATAHNRHFQLHWMFNDLVIAVSEATRQYHRRHNFVSPRRLVTIHNFIDQRRITPGSQETRRRMRQSLGIDDRWPLVGAVGEVVPDKGYPYLVEAVPRILAAVPEARFAFAGGDKQWPDYVAQIKATADRLGVASKILWLGHRNDVPELLAVLDLFVVASVEENFPLAMLEAMAAGLPVVATAVGGIPGGGPRRRDRPVGPAAAKRAAGRRHRPRPVRPCPGPPLRRVGPPPHPDRFFARIPNRPDRSRVVLRRAAETRIAPGVTESTLNQEPCSEATLPAVGKDGEGFTQRR